MGAFGGHEVRERRWTGLDKLESRNRAPRSLLVALVLASITLITLDVSGGSSSPVEPVRHAVGEAFGPAEAGVAAAVRPFTAVPAWFRTKGDLADQVRAWVAAHVPAGIESDVRVPAGGVAPCASDLDSPAMDALLRSIAQAFDTTADQVLFTREGGSGPEADLADILEAPLVFVAVGLDGDRIHAPNEKVEIPLLLKGAETAGRARLKTGTLRDVRSIAGYVYPKNAEPTAFVLFFNGVSPGDAKVKKAEDAILAKLISGSGYSLPDEPAEAL